MTTAKVIEWYRPSQVKVGKWVAPSLRGKVLIMPSKTERAA